MQDKHKELFLAKFKENLEAHKERYESYFANSKGLKKQAAALNERQVEDIEQSFQKVVEEEGE